MADLYGLDAQAAQVRARLREGEEDESIVIEVSIIPGEPTQVEAILLGVKLAPRMRWRAERIEDALKEALAWLEKRDAEGGR